MFRTIVCSAALILALILAPILALSLNAVAAPACDDAECHTVAVSKPLDIMKFMREQAASTRTAHAGRTRTAKPRPSKAQPVAHMQRPVRRAVAARPKPAGVPAEAAVSYASQQPAVPVVASDEFNDIDRAAPATATPAETTGTAMAAEPNVQLVIAEEFNDIDRMAEDRPPLSATVRVADAHAGARQPSEQPSAAQPNVSWLQSIWSALGNLFAALATAVHQLVGL
jgi:hypothetical protein